MRKKRLLPCSLSAILLILALFTGLAGCSDCADSVRSSTYFGDGTPLKPTRSPERIRQVISVHTVYIDGVEIFCTDPQVLLSGAVTDGEGNYLFEVDAPVGTSFTLTFHKRDHVIHSVSMTMGENGILYDETTVVYELEAVGYIPLTSAGIEGRANDVFKENIGLLNAPVDVIPAPSGEKLYISDISNGRIRILDRATAGLCTSATREATVSAA